MVGHRSTLLLVERVASPCLVDCDASHVHYYIEYNQEVKEVICF